MIKFFSRLPMRALYAFSAFLYVLAFYVVRHRHQVIRDQLEKAFPDLGGAQRGLIHKQFLKNFCDVMVEVLKSASMTESDMCARMALESCVRWRLSISRTRCSIMTLCCSGVFTATKRMVGRVTASQIASASAASFLPRFT